MPEIGNLSMPKRLLVQGVHDMVRISDARMSGTAYGACILHVAPEAAVGGPFALVRTGDMVHVDVAARTLAVDLDEEEMAARHAQWTPPAPASRRGWTSLYVQHVQQADQGVDLDFLVGASGDAPGRAAF